jgi:hypothetical protein
MFAFIRKILGYKKNKENPVDATHRQKKRLSQKLYEYMSNTSNGNSVGARAKILNNGDLHNTCVYYVSEALRRVGVNIPIGTDNTDELVSQLKSRGFTKGTNLADLKPGDIAFTTDINGGNGHPSHSYIFLGWASPGVAKITDNQVYHYSSFYHHRLITFHYLNNDRSKPKEATLFYMRNE